MIITRTPLRITLGGGGSDLERGTGFCVSAAITVYMTIAVNRPLTDGYLLRYSETEQEQDISKVKHPLFRAALARKTVPPGVEITSMCDVPAGTGLGSSGAFTVGLLHALDPDAGRASIVADACALDTGQQDQYAAAYGGVAAYDFTGGTIMPINTWLDSKMALYYTGTSREYSQQAAIKVSPVDLHQQAMSAIDALQTNQPLALGRCLNEQWRTKLAAAPTPFHRSMDTTIKHGLANGGTGGKLVGAGGGGFLLFVTNDHSRLHYAMMEHGLRRLPFSFDWTGTVRIV